MRVEDFFRRSIEKSSTLNNYRKTMERFETILRDKLHILAKSEQNFNIESISSAQTNFGTENFDVKELDASLLDFPVNTKSINAASNINSFLKNTKLEGMGEVFEQAQEKYGVNAYFLASLAVHESNYGESKIAQDKNNLFGMGAYDSNPYKYAKSFSSLKDGIMYTAMYIRENYLEKDGKYYSGVNVSSIGKRYATDPKWANKVNNIMQKMINK